MRLSEPSTTTVAEAATVAVVVEEIEPDAVSVVLDVGTADACASRDGNAVTEGSSSDGKDDADMSGAADGSADAVTDVDSLCAR